jgi:hypothetical protein
MKKTLLLIFIFFATFQLIAGHTSGGELTYRYLGNKKFEVSVIYYRDCRGIPLNGINYAIRCSSTGTTKIMSFTRISIRDISPTCASAGILCSPSNTTIGSQDPAVEAHLYKDTIDFGGSESAFYSCGTILLGTGLCCRSGAITTGGSGNDFWVYSTLNLSKSLTNSSPYFSMPATLIAVCNQPLKVSFQAIDTVDGDSLSYSLTEPLTGWASKVTWTGNLNAFEPFTAYYPSGYNKSKGPAPDNTPPIGIYLDPETGLLSGQPTDCNETTIMAISVKEWRKDTSGKYVQVGEIVRDLQLIVKTAPGNNYPNISANSSYQLCEGERFDLKILSVDKPFTPPPPLKQVLNDTVRMSYSMNIKGAIFAIDNSNVKQDAGVFQWTPTKSDIRKAPYIVNITVKDNACPIVGMVSRAIKLYVNPKVNVTSNVKKISNGVYEHQLNISDKSQGYIRLNSVKSDYPYDTRAFYFKSSKDLNSGEELDTLIINKNGKYILTQNYVTSVACNQKTTTDTLIVSGLVDVSLSYNLDTLICKNLLTRFDAKVLNAKKPVQYTWTAGSWSHTDTLGYIEKAFGMAETLHVTIKDANNFTNSTRMNVGVYNLPEMEPLQDKKTCEGITALVIAKSLKKDTLVYSWSLNGTEVSTNDSFVLTTPGKYVLQAINKRNCWIHDTIDFSHFITQKVAVNSGKYCQEKNNLVQSEIFKKGSEPTLFSQLVWSLPRTLPKPGGNFCKLSDLLSDLNPGSGFDYLIQFDKSRVEVPHGNYKDSLKFGIQAWDLNGCTSNAILTLVIVEHPAIEFGFRSFSICAYDTLDLNSKVLAEGSSSWSPLNLSGYSSWPASGNISNGIILPNYFSRSGGNYKVKITAANEICLSKDSVDIVINSVPMPKISYTTFFDSIKFTDNSQFATSRKWYLNNVYVGKDAELRLKKSDVHLVPLKLELNNSNCASDTTIQLNTASTKQNIKTPFKLFPNPTAGVLNIETQANWANAEFEISDLTGKLLIRGELSGYQTEIPVSQLETGLYLIKIKNNEQTFSLRFVKGGE